MFFLPNILLFAITLLGGSIPLWKRKSGSGVHDTEPEISSRNIHLLLAFSGSFLLSITFLHLIPESFTEIGSRAGFYILTGFFFQLIIQRITHGVEHGHAHGNDHQHGISLLGIITGLSVHAFMEGLPLGFHYREQSTNMMLYLAVGGHKLPEAMILTALVAHVGGNKKAWMVLFFFSLITPAGSFLAEWAGTRYLSMRQIVTVLIPLVAGSFVHIATTIFFESGTRQHLLTWQKVLTMITGAGLGFLSLLLE